MNNMFRRLPQPMQGENPARRLLYLIAALLLLAVGGLGIGVASNNLPQKSPDASEMRRSLDGAIDWLVRNRLQIEADPNPALWWMLATANFELRGDPRLSPLLADYYEILAGEHSSWQVMFKGPEALPLEIAILGTPDYQVFFLYALTCSSKLEKLEAVQEELAANYCPANWVLQPHCSTHQLMGLLWGLQNHCDGTSLPIAASVAKTVRRQLTLDFRVNDAYIQHAMMLANSREPLASLKPVWISRILHAQLPGGGWDERTPLLSLKGSKYLVLEGGGSMRVRNLKSAFHTTAQAILLLTRLLNPSQDDPKDLQSWYRLPGDD